MLPMLKNRDQLHTVAIENTDDITRHLLEQLSGMPIRLGDPDGLRARGSRPDFGRWLKHVAKAGGCTNPIRLTGESLSVQASTGVVVDTFRTDDLPDRVLYKPCGTRLASRCPSCAEVYRWDTYQLIKAGLVGGKGVPATIAGHPAVFVTLTAPSFGHVHSRPSGRDSSPRPCRARRDKPTCQHGKPLWCNALHAEDDTRLGQPLCLDCYDHQGHVVWNHLLGQLWSRTILRVRRAMGATGDHAFRIRYAKVAEYQRRGVIHLHALVRIDGFDPDRPDDFLEPGWVDAFGNRYLGDYTADHLKDAIEQAAATTALRTDPHPSQPDGWKIQFGAQTVVKVVNSGLPGVDLTEKHVAGYLAKYATKGTEITGMDDVRRITMSNLDRYDDPARHTHRLVQACWTLGGASDEWYGLRHWAHRFGFAGHFSSKSRCYSTTLTRLRHARRPQNRIRVTAIDGDPVELAETHDDETTLVIATWTYAGTGWMTRGDAALAAMAADAARQRVPAGLTANNQN